MASHSEKFFDLVPVASSDYEGLDPSEAYACGLEVGCFIQAVSISQQVGETLKIRIPSERASLIAQLLERLGEEGQFYWVNDDVMRVVVER